MLVLTCKEKEWVVLRDRWGVELARVCVTAVKGDRALLGFVAPRDVMIMRGELDERAMAQGGAE